MVRFTLIAVVVTACWALAGCGGNSSGNPFGTSSDTRGDLGTRGSTTDTTKGPARLVPVFLTAQAASELDDLWITVQGLEVQSSSASTKVFAPGANLSIRLGEFRDEAGQRSIFLGMAPAGPRLVRAQMSLDATTRQFVTGQEKPLDKQLSSASRKIMVDLEPNSEFKDAMVYELQVTSGEKNAIDAKLVLGKAEVATDLRRQRPTILAATLAEVPKTTEPKLVSATIGGQKVLCRLSVRYEIPGSKAGAKKGVPARVYGVLDVASNCFDSYFTLVGDSTNGVVLGQGLAITGESGDLVVRRDQASGAVPATSNVVLSLGAKTVVVSDEGKPLSAEALSGIIEGRPIWSLVAQGKSMVGVLPTPKVEPNRDRHPMPPVKDKATGA